MEPSQPSNGGALLPATHATFEPEWNVQSPGKVFGNPLPRRRAWERQPRQRQPLASASANVPRKPRTIWKRNDFRGPSAVTELQDQAPKQSQHGQEDENSKARTVADAEIVEDAPTPDGKVVKRVRLDVNESFVHGRKRTEAAKWERRRSALPHKARNVAQLKEDGSSEEADPSSAVVRDLEISGHDTEDQIDAEVEVEVDNLALAIGNADNLANILVHSRIRSEPSAFEAEREGYLQDDPEEETRHISEYIPTETAHSSNVDSPLAKLQETQSAAAKYLEDMRRKLTRKISRSSRRKTEIFLPATPNSAKAVKKRRVSAATDSFYASYVNAAGTQGAEESPSIDLSSSAPDHFELEQYTQLQDSEDLRHKSPIQTAEQGPRKSMSHGIDSITTPVNLEDIDGPSPSECLQLNTAPSTSIDNSLPRLDEGLGEGSFPSPADAAVEAEVEAIINEAILDSSHADDVHSYSSDQKTNEGSSINEEEPEADGRTLSDQEVQAENFLDEADPRVSQGSSPTTLLEIDPNLQDCSFAEVVASPALSKLEQSIDREVDEAPTREVSIENTESSTHEGGLLEQQEEVATLDESPGIESTASEEHGTNMDADVIMEGVANEDEDVPFGDDLQGAGQLPFSDLQGFSAIKPQPEESEDAETRVVEPDLPAFAAESNKDAIPTDTESLEQTSSIKVSLNDDDTDILKEFLSRAKASKAAKIANQSSLLNRRDSDVVKYALASPRRVPDELDAISPCQSKDIDALPTQDTSVITRRLEGESVSSPTKEPFGATDEDELGDVDEPVQVEPTVRRSTRSRDPSERTDKPPPSLSSTPSSISIRRQDDSNAVVLKKSEVQELAMLTRTNTRRNKGGALPARVMLMKLKGVAVEEVAEEDEPLASEGRVRWNEDLVAYFEEGKKDLTRKVEDESSAATAVSKPRARRAKMLGAMNGTPAKVRSLNIDLTVSDDNETVELPGPVPMDAIAKDDTNTDMQDQPLQAAESHAHATASSNPEPARKATRNMGRIPTPAKPRKSEAKAQEPMRTRHNSAPGQAHMRFKDATVNDSKESRSMTSAPKDKVQKRGEGVSKTRTGNVVTPGATEAPKRSMVPRRGGQK